MIEVRTKKRVLEGQKLEDRLRAIVAPPKPREGVIVRVLKWVQRVTGAK